MSILKLRTWLTPGAPAVERLCLSSTPAPYVLYMVILGLPWWFRQKRICLQCGRDLGSIPGLGRSPGGGHGNPLQCSCLENPHGQRAWRVESMGLQRVGRDWAAKHSRQAPLFLLFLGGLRREWASPTLPTHARTHTHMHPFSFLLMSEPVQERGIVTLSHSIPAATPAACQHFPIILAKGQNNARKGRSGLMGIKCLWVPEQ